MAVEKRQLGKTGIEITPIGLGCWQLGKMRGPLNFYKTPTQEEADKIIRIALDGGINWFDTAEFYGKGDSERALSKALVNAGKKEEDVVIATKWFPTNSLPFIEFPFLPRTAHSISDTVTKRQECLNPFKINLYQIHRPWSISSIEAQMDEMAVLVKSGIIHAVGVSHFSVTRMRQAYDALAKHGIPLASNQVRYNLLSRNPERDGVLETAKRLNVTIIAYSPLAQGLLTGRFHKNPESIKKLPFLRRRIVASHTVIEKSRMLIKTLEDVARSYNCSAAEVSLSWTVNFHKDVIVAIPGATKTEQMLQNIGAMNLKLTNDEMAKLDELSRSIIY
jgi:aryl-alcohol dehydrogenase-like predicted oxidoreductase